MRGSDLLGRSAEAGANAPLGSSPRRCIRVASHVRGAVLFLWEGRPSSPFSFSFCGNGRYFGGVLGMEYDQIGSSAPAQHRRQKRWAASQRGQLCAGLLLPWVCAWWGSCDGAVACQSGREPRMQLTAAPSALRAPGALLIYPRRNHKHGGKMESGHGGGLAKFVQIAGLMAGLPMPRSALSTASQPPPFFPGP